jgi:hypothetical protein
MKCHRFNRDRSFAATFSRLANWRKNQMYKINTNRSRLLDSCYLDSQTWGALHKAWKGYIIAKNKDELDKLLYYAEVIQKLQGELGLPMSSFPSLGLIPQGQADHPSKVYDPYEEYDRTMRNEQTYDPYEAYDRTMRNEQTYDPYEEYDRTMQNDQE